MTKKKKIWRGYEKTDVGKKLRENKQWRLIKRKVDQQEQR